MSRALHILQDNMIDEEVKITNGLPIFDFGDIEIPLKLAKNFLFPYEKFFINYNKKHESYLRKGEYVYTECSSLFKDDPGYKELIINELIKKDDSFKESAEKDFHSSYNVTSCFNIYYKDKNGNIIKSRYDICIGTFLMYRESISPRYKVIVSTFPVKKTKEELEIQMRILTGYLQGLMCLFESPKVRRIEESPKKIKESSVHPVRTHERPIIRFVDVDQVRIQYEKSTGKTGMKMPPHPRRAHIRTLNSDWFVNKKGQTVEVKACNVNGWEWKNSKGVTYKIV
jgi:hypothetical protein